MRAYLPEWLRERRNHRFKNESTVFAQELVLKYESWKVLREILPYEFFSSTPQSNREINFRNKFSIPLCPHMKIANVHVGTIDRNVRIALQFSYRFAIFISVCNFHISLQFSLFGVWFLLGRLQFSYWFAIFISVCNFHISLQFSLFGVWFLRGRLQFSYGFAIFIWVCNFHISLQFSRHDWRTSYVHGFIRIPM
jgi:hypothetical protein